MIIREGESFLENNQKLFALDIGTRSVVGIILEENGDQYEIVDYFSKEHTERSMIDGQIHNVLSVSKTIVDVKNHLEKEHGPLNKVCVAAAGRSLKTDKALASVQISGRIPLTIQDIQHLELAAVQNAQTSVAEKIGTLQKDQYYCVGYSILHYLLDDEPIGSLLDQQGKEASIEIIATFLPKIVVESLISALSRANLEIEALTLEPIAAINVLIPPSMRKLNIALVDIGAGTSDIAISDNGTVIAYGMVPLAGDEVTEAISEDFLLDFHIAEDAKRKLHYEKEIKVLNILGKETLLLEEEVINKVSPILENLAEKISTEILSLNNQKTPKAVMLIGGGSLTPDLLSRLQHKLDISEDRIAILGLDAVQGLALAEHIKKGPEFVTPIGIAITAKNSPVKYRTVFVNKQPIRLFEMNKLTVGDCLLAAGVPVKELYGKTGKSLFITINGRTVTLPGLPGDPPNIMVDDVPCYIHDFVQNGARITVEKGKDGKPCRIQIKELFQEIPAQNVKINGATYNVQYRVTCNGVTESPDKIVEDMDELEFGYPGSIEDLFKFLHLGDLLDELRPFQLKLNGRDTFLPRYCGRLLKNGEVTKPYDSYQNLDEIEVLPRKALTVKQLADLKKLVLSAIIPITFNGRPIKLKKNLHEFYKNDQLLKENDVIHYGDEIVVKEQFFTFQDLLKTVSIQMPLAANGRFVLLRNEKEARFEDRIEPGDHLRIIWKIQQQV